MVVSQTLFSQAAAEVCEEFYDTLLSNCVLSDDKPIDQNSYTRCAVPSTRKMDKSDLPLVSVILPTYNRPKRLSMAIESVLKQTYSNLDLIIVDDCSQPPPEDTITSFDKNSLQQFHYIRHGENRGASAARNTGINAARGDLLAFLDDDDVWKPTKLEQQVNLLKEAKPSVGAVYTGIQSVDSDESTIRIRSGSKKGDLTKEFLCGYSLPFPSVVLRREIVDLTGPFDESLPSWEDREWLLRVSEHCEFEVIDAPLVVSQRGESHDQLSADFTTKSAESYPRVVKSFRRVAKEYGWLFERKSYGYLTFNLGYAALRNGKYKQARTFIFNALIQWPFASEFYLYGLFAALGNRWYNRAQAIKRRIARYRHNS